MIEQNQQTLLNALRQLPEYDPPATVWEGIGSALDAEVHLAESLKTLAGYEPPDEIWSSIETKLNRVAKPEKRPALRLSWFRSMAAAAAVIGMVLAGWWLLRPGVTQIETFAVTQEVVDDQILATVLEPEDNAFDLVQNLCQERAPVCQQPEFKALKNELDELTSAKNELRQALGPYGNDPEMTAQLVRIERERSELLQQMMQMI